MKLTALNLIIDIIWSKVETIPILVAKLLDLYYKLLKTDPKFQKVSLFPINDPKNPGDMAQKQTLNGRTSPYHFIGEFPPSPGITSNKAICL